MNTHEQNRFCVTSKSGGITHVIHEGLNNYPSLKDELSDIIKKLQSDEINNHSHLADIGCHIGFQIDRLKNLQSEIFAMHEHEKANGV